ncbi:hypothetical protein FOA52_014309 [Chlamydomonas sp. UWO 241]|nr:hypothetical protein FOA52_014309 [Chlamydomonas sp. UWO 241]
MLGISSGPVGSPAPGPALQDGQHRSTGYTQLSATGDGGGTGGDDEPGARDVPAAGAVIGGVQLPSTRVLVLIALGIAAVELVVSGVGVSLLEAAKGFVGPESGLAGAAIFIAVYVSATVLLFPASVLTLAAGALYGPFVGTALVSIASTLGATAAFVVSRYAARPFVEARLADYPRLRTVVGGISAQGAKFVLLLRLSPLFPFNLLNYALGVTSVSLLEYVAASWAGMLPGTFAYVFLGSTGRAAADAASGGIDPIKLVLYAVGAVATLAVTKVAADAASKALEEAERAGGEGGGRQP